MIFLEPVLGDPGDDGVGLGGVPGEVDLHAGRFGVLLEFLVEFVQPRQDAVLGLGDLGHQPLDIEAGKGPGPAGPVGDGEGVKGLAQEIVIQGFLHLLAVFFEISGILHDQSSSRRMCNSRGPCTPRARTRSISAVRLAPVMKAV